MINKQFIYLFYHLDKLFCCLLSIIINNLIKSNAVERLRLVEKNEFIDKYSPILFLINSSY
jgi:hypothetical protein